MKFESVVDYFANNFKLPFNVYSKALDSRYVIETGEFTSASDSGVNRSALSTIYDDYILERTMKVQNFYKNSNI